MTALLRRLPAAPTRARHAVSSPPGGGARVRCIATLSRTYDDAMQLLKQLQPNAAAKGLFAPNASPASPSPSSPPGPSPNDGAIPEMHAWLTKASIDASALPFRAIHVAGTKGKGTTATYAAAIIRQHLRGQGASTGLYTSPHLVSVRERIQVDGARLARGLFARYFFEVWDAVGCAPEEDPGGGGLCSDGRVRPFYFRFLTILAFHVFVREGIRDVVMECGIGGEYDATNVLPASAVSASVVTHLELDHVAMLGSTLESIAWHKSGIFKPGVPAFTREHPPPVMDVLRARAAEKGAELVVVTAEEAARWGASRPAAPFQEDNRALAAAAAHCHLFGAPGPLTQRQREWAAGAMRGARIRGRAEVLRRGDAVFALDGAHTPESVAGIGQWFAGLEGKDPGAPKSGSETEGPRRSNVLIFNQQERDAQALLEALLHSVPEWTFDEAIFTRNEAEGEGRDAGVQEGLAEAMGLLAPGTKVSVCSNVGEALDKARGIEGGPRVLVTGSMYLVGAVLRALEGDVN